jgi:arginyl-tRNA synthetase
MGLDRPHIMDFRTALLQDLQRIAAQMVSQPLEIGLAPSERHADLASNAAFLVAPHVGQTVQEIAQIFSTQLAQSPFVDKVMPSPQGFINITLKRKIWQDVLQNILETQRSYGKSSYGKGARVNVEYVSANPTGPLHGGHTRSAIVGDIIANLLDFVGYAVTREYFINDAGKQIDILVQSVQAHIQAIGENRDAVIPPGLYPGSYVKEIAERFLAEGCPRPLESFAIQEMMRDIRQDLEALGVCHNVFVSEKTLQQEGKVQEAVDVLTKKGLVYEGTLPCPKGEEDESWSPKPLLLFKSTEFGDDQDRPLKKADGSWTYFAGDIAYHWDKFRRGFATLIDIFGADHASHVLRTKAAVACVTENQAQLEVVICQIVRFFDKGVAFRMSKRAGTFITLQDILQDIDRDTLRFMVASIKVDTHVDFDLEEMKAQTKDNPVFYVQYAHARCCSVLRAAESLFDAATLAQPPDLSLLLEDELSVVKVMADWPRQVHQAALSREPHRIPTYLYKLATAFHGLWQKGRSTAVLRFLQVEDPQLSMAHLAVVRGVSYVIAAGLCVLGVEPKEEM